MSDYTGPGRPPEVVMTQWRHRMKDFLNPIQARGMGIACHPNDKAMMKDALEWLREQDTWPHDDVPPLLITSRVKEGEVQPVDVDTLRVLTMAQVNQSRSGFGRFKGLYLPRDGGIHNPWRPN